jgi:hypothetical protein
MDNVNALTDTKEKLAIALLVRMIALVMELANLSKT